MFTDKISGQELGLILELLKRDRGDRSSASLVRVEREDAAEPQGLLIEIEERLGLIDELLTPATRT